MDSKSLRVPNAVIICGVEQVYPFTSLQSQAMFSKALFSKNTCGCTWQDTVDTSGLVAVDVWWWLFWAPPSSVANKLERQSSKLPDVLQFYSTSRVLPFSSCSIRSGSGLFPASTGGICFLMLWGFPKSSASKGCKCKKKQCLIFHCDLLASVLHFNLAKRNSAFWRSWRLCTEALCWWLQDSPNQQVKPFQAVEVNGGQSFTHWIYAFCEMVMTLLAHARRSKLNS